MNHASHAQMRFRRSRTASRSRRMATRRTSRCSYTAEGSSPVDDMVLRTSTVINEQPERVPGD